MLKMEKVGIRGALPQLWDLAKVLHRLSYYWIRDLQIIGLSDERNHDRELIS